MIKGLNPAMLLGLSTPASSTNLSGARFGVQAFAADGTFTLPPGITSVTALAIVVGGGGGGSSGRGHNGDPTNAGSNGSNSVFGTTTANGGSGGNTGGTVGYAAPQAAGPIDVNAGGNWTATLERPGTDGGWGPLSFGNGGRGGSTLMPFSSINPATRSGGPGGYSGEIAIFFGLVNSNTSVVVGDGGSGGAAVAPSAGIFYGQAGQKGGKGFVAVFYWW